MSQKVQLISTFFFLFVRPQGIFTAKLELYPSGPKPSFLRQKTRPNYVTQAIVALVVSCFWSKTHKCICLWRLNRRRQVNSPCRGMKIAPMLLNLSIVVAIQKRIPPFLPHKLSPTKAPPFPNRSISRGKAACVCVSMSLCVCGYRENKVGDGEDKRHIQSYTSTDRVL